MNDMFPEEQDPQFEELITLLRQIDLTPPLIVSTEREKIIAHARERLFPPDSEASESEGALAPVMPELGSFSSKPKVGADKLHRGSRLIHMVSALAAVLVVAALIGTTLLLFGPWSLLQRDHSATAPPIGPEGAPVQIYTGTFSSLAMSLEITPGPYFLGELLEVDLSVTNHSHNAYLLSQPPDSSGCHSLLSVATKGGGSPYANEILSNWTAIDTGSFLNCNWPRLGSQQGYMVLASKKITITQYVQLTSSRQVTLAAQVGFREWRYAPGSTAVTRWNLLGNLDYTTLATQHLSVSALVPSDRRFSVKEQGTQVTALIPPPTYPGPFLSDSVGACSQGGKTLDISDDRGRLLVLSPKAGCKAVGGASWWMYVVGAPGYAVISGEVAL
jgi:hypothetical protein